MSATAAETRIAELEAALAAAGAALAQGQAAVLTFSFSRETQLWVTTHARALADALAARGARSSSREKVDGFLRRVTNRLRPAR